MEQSGGFITDILGPFGPVYITGAIALILILCTLPLLLKKNVDPFKRIKEAQDKNDERSADVNQALRIASGPSKLDRYSSFLEPQDEEEYSAIQLKLLQAGFPGKHAVQVYQFAQIALGLGLLAVGALLVFIKLSNGDEMDTTQKIMWFALPGLAGYMFPKYWVTRQAGAREEAIIQGFPDALDMILVCVEAGQSLDQSILRVSSEIRPTCEALADEFSIVSNELKAGKDRESVLRDLGKRSGTSDVDNFVTVMIQSAEFGTSIADALRVYSAEMRDKRVIRAEEKANTLPTKMTLATMMLTLPPLLIVLIGPSIHDIYLTFQEFGK